MRIRNQTSCTQVFGQDLVLAPNESGDLPDTWAPRLAKAIARGNLAALEAPKQRAEEKVDLIDLVNEPDEEAELPEDYLESHFATRKAFVRKADLHVLEVVFEHEKNAKIRELITDRILELKGAN